MRDDEKLEKHLTDVLNNHRNTLLGVQILLAGMLSVPFAAGFGRVTGELKVSYVTAVLSAGVASALLIAPSQYHRMHIDDPASTLRVGQVCGTIGTAALGVSVVAVVFMVVRFVAGHPFGIIASGVLAVLVAALWFALPLLGGRR